MATPAAIFTDAMFTGIPQTLPVGVNAPLNPTHVVRLAMSTGDTIILGTVDTLMRLVTAMRRRGTYMLNPTEDTFVALAGATKLVYGEMNFTNQKLLINGTFQYSQGRLEVLMRQGGCVETLDEALLCAGHYRPLPAPYVSTANLLSVTGVNSPRLIVVDYKFSETDGGTLFVDDPPLQERAPL